MSSQAFDGIRILSIGPITTPLEVVPGERTTVTMEGGQIKLVKLGETLSVTQGSSFTTTSIPGRGGSAFVNASVTASGSVGSVSATIRGEAASATADSDADTARPSDDAQAPDKITIYVPEGTAIQVKNYINGTLRVGIIKGSLAIDQMVNAQIAVEEITELEIKMLVNCHGYIHATGKVRSGMMVNCDVRID
ncbi:MAG: hypothetical protein WA970_12000 [Gammaproteobacteria bacterium]|jgi:hypothetical protein